MTEQEGKSHKAKCFGTSRLQGRMNTLDMPHSGSVGGSGLRRAKDPSKCHSSSSISTSWTNVELIVVSVGVGSPGVEELWLVPGVGGRVL